MGSHHHVDASAIHPRLQALVDVAPLIVSSIGSRSEVLVFDFRNPTHPIIALVGEITNGQITSINELIFTRLKSNDLSDIKGVRMSLPNGRELRTSISFVTDEAGTPIGAVAVNLDVTMIQRLIEWLRPMFDGIRIEELLSGENLAEASTNVGDMLEKIVISVIEERGISLLDVQREDAIEIVRRIDEQGGFLLRGSVNYVAKCLRLSRFTIYNYLRRIREAAKPETESSGMDSFSMPHSLE